MTIDDKNKDEKLQNDRTEKLPQCQPYHQV